ncbi:MAG TPA: cyclase family protein, partial [Mycobacterium sp.]|nr:cyclase family protein [Mycobacterium sp.]
MPPRHHKQQTRAQQADTLLTVSAETLPPHTHPECPPTRYGQFPEQCAVILNTGWHKRWPTERFANLDKNGVLRHPGFSLDAVQWLVREGALGHRGA